LKYVWNSKTIWVNVVLIILALLGFGGTLFALVAGAANIYLRFQTNTGVTTKKESQ